MQNKIIFKHLSPFIFLDDSDDEDDAELDLLGALAGKFYEIFQNLKLINENLNF
jgi:hypothetical protein